MKGATTIVPVERLTLSRSPAAEVAAGALEAQQEAELAQADLVVVAVEPGQGDVAEAAIAAALEQAEPQT